MKNILYTILNRNTVLIVKLFSIFNVFIILLFIIFYSLNNKNLTLFKYSKENYALSNKNNTIILDSETQNLSNLEQYSLLKSNYTYIKLNKQKLQFSTNINLYLNMDITNGVNNVEVYLDIPNTQNFLLYSQLLENLKWKNYTENNITVWQRDPDSLAINKITNTSKKALLVNVENIPNFKLDNYTKNTQINEIYTPVRGDFKTAFYIGNKEKLYLKIYKRDLNFYDNEDTLSIKLLDDQKNIIKTYNIPDDGISIISNNYSTNLQDIEIKENNLKEGLYFLNFEQKDSIVEKIETSLSKFVFINNLFLANNNYYTPDARPLNLFTNGSEFNFTVIHENALQNINIGNTIINIDKVNNLFNFKNKEDLIIFNSQIGNIYINSNGIFATDISYYFNPFPLIIFKYNQYDSSIKYDFIIAQYSNLIKINNFYTKEISIPIDSYILKNKNIRLVIKQDKLNENDGLIIKEMKITY